MKKTEYNNKISEYDEQKVKKFFAKFKNNLLGNKDYLEKANEIDTEITRKKIKIETIIEIIDNYANVKFQNLDKTFIVYYKGDPYLTINLFLQALLNRSKVILAQDEFMLATNEILITIFNKTLKELKIENVIQFCKYEKKQIMEVKELVGAELIGIGDTLMYQILEEEGMFYPYYNLIMYCDSDMLNPIKEAVSIYSNENHYELEMVYEEDINIAINYINMIETSNIVILLSNNEVTIKNFKERVNKKLFINENPFLKSYGKIYQYLK